MTASDEKTQVETPASGKRDWSGQGLLFAAVAAIFWALIAAYGGGWDFWSRDAAITQLYWAFALGLLVAAVSVALIVRRRKRLKGGFIMCIAAIILSLALCIYLASWAIKGWGSAGLHDVSTDLADPPQYRVIALRPDNYDNVPGADDEDMRGLSPRQRWEQIHREEYPGIRTVRIDRPVPAIIETAQRLAEDRGWDIVAVDAAAGRMEARSSYSPLDYEQDIVLRVRPAERRGSAVIDMRSVSRQANDDLGVNADIVRGFLSDLSGTTSQGVVDGDGTESDAEPEDEASGETAKKAAAGE